MVSRASGYIDAGGGAVGVPARARFRGSTSRPGPTGRPPATRTVDVQSEHAGVFGELSVAVGGDRYRQPRGVGDVHLQSAPRPTDFSRTGTQVTVTVVPANGFKFVKWSGDFSGNFTTGYLTMSGPHAITAYQQAVPFIAPAGIVSAAGATPDGTMAPGSVISIYGNSLAPALQVAAASPLPQTLGNVTVTIGNYLLPLLFVSPGQINAQLPSELVDGSYTLTVSQTGQPDVTGTLTVSRDAPGVFTQANAQQLPLVLALHQDGTLVTLRQPGDSRRNDFALRDGFRSLRDHGGRRILRSRDARR